MNLVYLDLALNQRNENPKRVFVCRELGEGERDMKFFDEAWKMINDLVCVIVRQDFVTIEDFRDFLNTMMYTVQEIFFRLHQGPGLDDHARTFSSLLLAEVDKRNLNPLKQMRIIEQLRGTLLGSVPEPFSLSVLRRLGSIFTLVYAVVQKLKKDSWKELQFSLVDNSKLNVIPRDQQTPYEIWHGKAPKLSYLRVWGCKALVKRDTPDKLDPRSIKCIFVGYPKETMGYYFFYPLENKIFVARNVDLFEINLIVQEASGSHGLLKSSGSDKGLDTQPSENTSKEHNEVAPTEVEP
ncbi:retrotransposon protein, putative, ty1-copia subclass [Tanacetum coccineum]